MTNRTTLYLISALALLTITLGTFAVMSPFNGATNDEWSYLYMGKIGQWQGVLVNRDFSAGGTVIADFLLPNRAQNLHVIHVLATYFVSLGLFHIAYRLMRGYAWLAFSIAAVYLLYIPYNMEQSRAFYIEPYSWAMLLMVICAGSLVEYFFQNGGFAWLCLFISAGMAYVSSRVYEGFIPFLVLLPIAYWVLVYFTDKDSPSSTVPPLYLWRGGQGVRWKSFLVGLALWYALAGIGSLQFVIPYVRGDAAVGYQTRIQSADENDNIPKRLVTNTAEFLDVSFPIQDEILTTHFNYTLPSVLLASLAIIGAVLLWRKEPNFQKFPHVRFWLLTGLIGLGITLLGGLAFIYAGLHLEMRSQFIAAPGEAVTLVSLAGLAAWTLSRISRVPAPYILVAIASVFFVTAGQWQLESQVWAVENRSPTFDAKTPFFRELVALLPELEPNTAILYQCPDAQIPKQVSRLSDLFAVEYLYDGRGVELISMPYHFAPLRVPSIAFTATGLDYSHQYDLHGSPEVSFHYGYDEMIFLECVGETFRIAEHFPADLAPAKADTKIYNPYARITGGFIAPDDASILAR